MTRTHREVRLRLGECHRRDTDLQHCTRDALSQQEKERQAVKSRRTVWVCPAAGSRERGGGPEVGQRAVDVVHRAEELRRDVHRDAVEAEGAGVLEHLAPEAAQRHRSVRVVHTRSPARKAVLFKRLCSPARGDVQVVVASVGRVLRVGPLWAIAAALNHEVVAAGLGEQRRPPAHVGTISKFFRSGSR